MNKFATMWSFCFITSAMFNLLVIMLFGNDIYENVDYKDELQFVDFVTETILSFIVAPLAFCFMVDRTFMLMFNYKKTMDTINKAKLDAQK